jgi:DNA-binding NarL/FixJ family response regulator
MHHDADLATDAIRGGASGFLLKESAGDELLTAVRHALDGGTSRQYDLRRERRGCWSK